MDKIDITPTPRVLRTLGDIPFDVWQCFAELIDNSLDAFKEAAERGELVQSPKIDVYWSSQAVTPRERVVVVEDNGPGMTLEVMQKASKAGYSSNDPIHNLGLFGMGFNIATARLGDQTILLSTRSGDSEWVGIRIDFETLIRNQTFSADVVRRPKEDPSASGTKIEISQLKEGVFNDLKSNHVRIMRRLEAIYTPILEKNDVAIDLQAKRLTATPHCVWSEERFVMRSGQKIYAVQPLDRDLGETFFDVFRNRYATEDEAADYELLVKSGGQLPSEIVRRSRRLKGWLGIQRYSDTSTFGIDFIRNGRKILIGDKSLFFVENPATGASEQEYPVELGSTVGGRIVGEVHVDYLLPTYQKNGFDQTDRGWRLTVEAIRGAGPMLPGKRKAFGYDAENVSPLGKLVNAFRRTDPGTKSLAVSKPIARELLTKFMSGEKEYQTDEKWYRAAQEIDQQKNDGGEGSTSVNSGDDASDDVDLYLKGQQIAPKVQSAPAASPTVSEPSPTSKRDDLIAWSDKQTSLSGKFSYSTAIPGFDVTAWRVRQGHVMRENSAKPPYILFQDGTEIDFFFDPAHSIFAEYPITPKQLLLLGLAEKFQLRDRSVSLKAAYAALVDLHMDDEKILPQGLIERAASIFSTAKDKLPELVGDDVESIRTLFRAYPSDGEALAEKIVMLSPSAFQSLQAVLSDVPAESLATDIDLEFLRFAPDQTVVRMVEALPEKFLDGKLFDMDYSSINLPLGATDRLRSMVKETIVSYLKDAQRLLADGGRRLSKPELIRAANTLSILESKIT